MENVIPVSFDNSPTFEQKRAYWEGYYANTLPSGYQERDLKDLHDCDEKRVLLAYDEASDDFGFLLVGKSGVGKTFILNALMNKVLRAAHIYQSSLVQTVAYFPIGYLIYQLRTKKDGQEFQRCLSAQFLFLDDLGTENTTDFAREHFFTILDIRCQKRKPTFITTNLSLNELSAKYGERITSRLKEMCAILEIKGNDKRAEILRDRVAELKQRMR